MFWIGLGAGIVATGIVGFVAFVWYLGKMMDGF